MPQSPLPELIPNLEGTLAANMDLLKECRVRTVNVLFVQGQRNPRYFTFPHSLSACRLIWSGVADTCIHDGDGRTTTAGPTLLHLL